MQILSLSESQSLQAIWKLFFNKHLFIDMKRLTLHFSDPEKICVFGQFSSVKRAKKFVEIEKNCQICSRGLTQSLERVT